ncbi:MAG: PAS domain S-box protein [Gammaproteobacteria bacterium]|nr:PAS domain S-box protein [Gammaproteobacteria bacterium]
MTTPKIHNAVRNALNSETLFQQVVESSPSAMVMVDSDGSIVLVNTQTERVFGYPRVELIGKPVELLVPERSHNQHREYRKKFLTMPESRPMRVGRDLYGRRKDGSEFPVEIGLNLIQSGSVSFVLSAIVDITERKRHEERIRQVVESAPSSMVMVDAKGIVVLINAQTERMFGYSRDELLGKPMEILVPERFRRQHPEYRRNFYSAPQSRPMEAGHNLYGLHKNGNEFPVEIGLNPIETEDGLMVLSAIVDISARQIAKQELETALKEKTVLLNEIHHRVKNNLQVIASLLNLQASHSGLEAQKILAESQNRIKTMALIHQLLYERKDFSRTHLGYYLERLGQLLRDTYSERRREISFKTAGMRHEVYLDIGRAIPCGLLVNEIVTNAYKYAFPDGRRGEICLSLQRTNSLGAELIISDSGVGLPEGIELGNARSLGFQLIPLLVEQLQAELRLSRTAGTRFSLIFTTGDE